MDDINEPGSTDDMFESMIVILVAGSLPCLYYGIGIAARLLADRRAASLLGTRRLALTYDDGPSPEQTDRLLTILADRNAKATFFLIGGSAERHPEVVKRIAAAGHEIGWHSQTHLNQWKCSPFRAWRDTASIPDVLHPLRPHDMTYRPPFGKLNLLSVLAAQLRGFTISTWTLPSGDTYSTVPSVEDVVGRVEAQGGGVILMHDFERDASDPRSADRDQFVTNLTIALLDLARDRDWKVVPVPESTRSTS